ncbi:MAG TPA: hypothetical protein VNU97_00160 [Rhizomicrobium sp.]|jgi:hypothetical protein|nr:hypothetical protein [Rhizomicrobium sp.]
MLRIAIATASLLLCAAPALAADDVMANYYGNTVATTSAMGSGLTHYRADHTFDSNLSSPMGSMSVKGTWAIDDKGQLCRTYETPPPGMTNPVCTPWEAHKVGDTWTVTIGGNARTVTLKAGIQ